ncbi:MAG: subclass B3 metallo-beta-lactamase [bacterium]
MIAKAALLASIVLPASTLVARSLDSAVAARRTANCSNCATWNAPQRPFNLHGTTYFVGTHGLSAVLITSPGGHILIDGGLNESAPLIASNIKALGFRIEDVKLIVNSHDHYDHAGGIAELQRLSGAVVAGSPPSAAVFKSGAVGRDDPQYGIAFAIAPVLNVRAIADGDTLRVGSLAIVAHFTPGHTPGGTSWTWRSCQAGSCRDVVYADSQTPVSADGFLFTSNTAYPGAVRDFERSEATLESLRCDILITPHPDQSSLWERVARKDGGQVDALVNPQACKDYAATARKALAKRIATETTKP